MIIHYNPPSSIQNLCSLDFLLITLNFFYFIYVLIAIIVIVGVWFIFAKVLKNKKPKEVTLKDIPIDLEALIHALGGIDNIKESQSQGSKVRFFVENDDLVKVNVLKELGASGVIQATGKVTVILGKFSDEISRIVNEKKSRSKLYWG